MTANDHDLLREFTRQHSQDAFAALVRRHVNLVYSAALRQVCSPQLAEEVSQSVFADLARDAAHLRPDTILTAWLYQVARRTAIDVVRRESRRQLREQIATEMNALNATPADWTHIEPLLDEAMHALDETDRAAILLRYFENKSLRDIGQTLGTSDDTAQKRVSRAVERLREFFAKRGVTVGASGLAVAISANAVQSAPAGLVLSISAATALVGTAVHTSTTIASAKIIAMTTLQKTIITATLAAAIGTGIYESRQAAHLREQFRALKQPASDQASRSFQEADSATNKPSLFLQRPGRLRLAGAASPIPLVTNASSAEPFTSTKMYALLKSKNFQLTPAQTEPYLTAKGRSAPSLLAAFRTARDPRLLAEAMQKYPTDPQVGFEAAIRMDAPTEERRAWLDAFKQSAPENALANYLSALDYFKAGDSDHAVTDLNAAASKPQFQDYSHDRIQMDEEAYLAAGYPPGEAKFAANVWLATPQLVQVRELGQKLIGLASSYQQSGDETSRQAVLQMAVDLGRRFGDPSSGEALANQLVGISVERAALGVAEPSSPYGTSGQTVQDRLDQLVQQKEAIHQLTNQTDPLWQTLSDQDWLNYHNQLDAVGEAAALRWLLSSHGPK